MLRIKSNVSVEDKALVMVELLRRVTRVIKLLLVTRTNVVLRVVKHLYNAVYLNLASKISTVKSM